MKQAKTWQPKAPATFQPTKAVIMFSALRSFHSARQIQRALISFQILNLFTSSFSLLQARQQLWGDKPDWTFIKEHHSRKGRTSVKNFGKLYGLIPILSWLFYIILDLRKKSFYWGLAYSTHWASGLKVQNSKNENRGIRSHHFRANRWGNKGNSDKTLFSWALKSLQMVTTAMRLKDAFSLEVKLWQIWTAY